MLGAEAHPRIHEKWCKPSTVLRGPIVNKMDKAPASLSSQPGELSGIKENAQRPLERGLSTWSNVDNHTVTGR